MSRQRGIQPKVDWILSMPVRYIAKADPVLSAYVEKADNEHCYEELCLLYVAITRAKRCLYMITSKRPENSATITHSSIIENASPIHSQR